MADIEPVPVKKLRGRKKRRVKRLQPHFLEVSLREGNFDEVNKGCLTKEEFFSEVDRCKLCRHPKCIEACPVNFNIKSMMQAIQEDDIEKALEYLYDTYCFPQSLDRVCPRFCEQACKRGRRGDPIQIMYIKRYLADHFARPADFTHRARLTGKKIAIIGSGPAGLTASYYLAKLGHEISVFEKAPIYGGMLTLGIPSYRLPRNIINSEIKAIEETSVHFIKNSTYAKDFDYKTLFDQGFNAVIIAHGAHAPKWMGLQGEQYLEGSLHVVPFLRDHELGTGYDVKGKKVVIIGGGDTAIDAARVSKRLGADAQIVYRRSREEMPADKTEIVETDKENIPIIVLTNPVAILSNDGKKVTGLTVIKMKLGRPDDSGRPRPKPITGSEYTIKCDVIIQAISQEPELLGDELTTTKWQTFKVDQETMATNIPGVYACGDNVAGPSTVVNAVAQAHIVVKAVHEYVLKN